MKKSILHKTIFMDSKLSKDQMNNILGGELVSCRCKPSMPNCGLPLCLGYALHENDDNI